MFVSFDSKDVHEYGTSQVLAHWICRLAWNFIDKTQKSFCQSTQNWFSYSSLNVMFCCILEAIGCIKFIWLWDKIKRKEKRFISVFRFFFLFFFAAMSLYTGEELDACTWTKAGENMRFVLFLAAYSIISVIACIQKYYSKLNKYNQLPSKQLHHSDGSTDWWRQSKCLVCSQLNTIQCDTTTTTTIQ